jgi:hypothetical protein
MTQRRNQRQTMRQHSQTCWGRFVRDFLLVSFAFLFAVILGFGSSYFLLEDGRRVSARTYGVWYGWPEIGSPDISPYQRAELARSSLLSLGRAEGIAFYAETDEAGEPLSGQCTYRISGDVPKSSAWTLQAVPHETVLIGERQRRTTDDAPLFRSSQEMNYQPNGRFDLTVANRAMPNNWLKSPDGQFQLVLRIYDTNAFVVIGHETVNLPKVIKEACA